MTSDGAAHITSDKTADSPSDVSIIPAPKGRPTKRTPCLVESILADIEAGDSERTAVLANDIAWQTWLTWKQDDPGLLDQCQYARAKGLRQVRREYKSTENPVRAKVCHHFLSVKESSEWSATQKIEHSGSVNVIATLEALFSADAGEEKLDGDTE